MKDARAPLDVDFDALQAPKAVLVGAALGGALALLVLPDVVPAVAHSLVAPQPKTWWYLSRASGLVAYAMLSVSMLLGLLLSTRFAKAWPGSASAFVLHEHASGLGLAAAIFHGLVLLGDRYTSFRPLEILLPFGASYRPAAVGLGQLALYGLALLVASFYARKRIGQRAWRWLHFASFLVYALALAHGVALGTDRGLVVAGLVPAAAVLFFGVYRTLAHTLGETPPPRRRAAGLADRAS
ncbi:MAG TPA: hypothetical protein VLM85_12495 [Polyangiaceae bacterium]|nr:hypothetical protein [Polyangiaceae bacterium]